MYHHELKPTSVSQPFSFSIVLKPYWRKTSEFQEKTVLLDSSGDIYSPSVLAELQSKKTGIISSVNKWRQAQTKSNGFHNYEKNNEYMQMKCNLSKTDSLSKNIMNWNQTQLSVFDHFGSELI